MVSLNKLISPIVGRGATRTTVAPMLGGASTEFIMKAVAFGKLPKPPADIIGATQNWLSRKEIQAGLATAFIIPLITRKKGGIAGESFGMGAKGYLGGKYVSDVFGVTGSPFFEKKEDFDKWHAQNEVPPVDLSRWR